MTIYINKKEVTPRDTIQIGELDYTVDMLLTAVRNYEHHKSKARERIRESRQKAREQKLVQEQI